MTAMAGSTHDAARPTGHGHGHGRRSAEVEVRRGPRLVLVGSLVAVLLLTVVGVGLLWPDGDRVDELSDEVQFAAPGVTFPEAEVLSVQEPCATDAPAEGCGQIEVRVAQRRRRRSRGDDRRAPRRAATPTCGPATPSS